MAALVGSLVSWCMSMMWARARSSRSALRARLRLTRVSIVTRKKRPAPTSRISFVAASHDFGEIDEGGDPCRQLPTDQDTNHQGDHRRNQGDDSQPHPEEWTSHRVQPVHGVLGQALEASDQPSDPASREAGVDPVPQPMGGLNDPVRPRARNLPRPAPPQPVPRPRPRKRFSIVDPPRRPSGVCGTPATRP